MIFCLHLITLNLHSDKKKIQTSFSILSLSVISNDYMPLLHHYISLFSANLIHVFYSSSLDFAEYLNEHIIIYELGCCVFFNIFLSDLGMRMRKQQFRWGPQLTYVEDAMKVSMLFLFHSIHPHHFTLLITAWATPLQKVICTLFGGSFLATVSYF